MQHARFGSRQLNTTYERRCGKSRQRKIESQKALSFRIRPKQVSCDLTFAAPFFLSVETTTLRAVFHILAVMSAQLAVSNAHKKDRVFQTILRTRAINSRHEVVFFFFCTRSICRLRSSDKLLPSEEAIAISAPNVTYIYRGIRTPRVNYQSNNQIKLSATIS